jgi:hypothetical protein
MKLSIRKNELSGRWYGLAFFILAIVLTAWWWLRREPPTIEPDDEALFI